MIPFVAQIPTETCILLQQVPNLINDKTQKKPIRERLRWDLIGTSCCLLICYKTHTLITTDQLNIFKSDYHRLPKYL